MTLNSVTPDAADFTGSTPLQLDGATRVYSDPKSITYGQHIIEFDLDGADNRE